MSKQAATMPALACHDLLTTGSVMVRDVVCGGGCRHKSPEECSQSTHLVFPYRGVFIRHLGRSDAVAEPNQVLIFNPLESYRISHPVAGGDGCLSLSIGEDWLRELVPAEYLRPGAILAFGKQHLGLDPRAQALVATLRYSLHRKLAEPLEGETLALTLIRRVVGQGNAHAAAASVGRRKLVERTKLLLSTDPARRWSLADIGAQIGVSPVYLTQVFQQLEGTPLYRYQLRLRLARALELLSASPDLAALGVDLGFSSHSHFTAAFRQAYGRSPAQFRRSLNLRQPTTSR
jgi:AraC-like DNA-binding protein